MSTVEDRPTAPRPLVAEPRPAPDGAQSPAVPAEEGLTDGALGRAMAFGFTGGTAIMMVICFVMSLVGHASIGTAAAISVVPGIVAGFFFGGTIWMSYEVVKAGH